MSYTTKRGKPTLFAKLILVIVGCSLFCAGCASADGGEVLSGVLQGVGQGLSGL